MSKKILVLAQRASDYIEMRRAVKNLAQYGYQFLFLFQICPFKLDSEILLELTQLEKQGVLFRESIILGGGYNIKNNDFLLGFEKSKTKGENIFSEKKIKIKESTYSFENKTRNIYKKTIDYFHRFLSKAVDCFYGKIRAAVIRKIKQILLYVLKRKRYMKLKRANRNFHKTRNKIRIAVYNWQLKKVIFYFVSRGRYIKMRKANRNIYRFRSEMRMAIKNVVKKHLMRSKIGVCILGIPYIFFILRVYSDHLSLYKKIVKLCNVDIILLPEDIVGLVTPLLIKAGHNFGIPSLIVPYTIANQEEAFQSLKNHENYQYNLIWNKLVGMCFRRWRKFGDGAKLLRMPAPYVLGQVFTKTAPPDPWMMNSGFANAIAVENERMFEYYKRSGISESKLKVVGAFYDDHIAKFLENKVEERERLYKELGIKNNKPLLVVGGCPNQFTANPPGSDFKGMEDLLYFLLVTIGPLKDNYNIVIRPHPNYFEFGDYFKSKGFIVSHLDTARLIALSDLYIAFASATIRWAIATGIPVVNFDAFYYNYSDYKNVFSVLHACSKAEFCLALENLKNVEYYDELKKAAENEKSYWGRLDGKSTHRIFTLIEGLCKEKPALRIPG